MNEYFDEDEWIEDYRRTHHTTYASARDAYEKYQEEKEEKNNLICELMDSFGDTYEEAKNIVDIWFEIKKSNSFNFQQAVFDTLYEKNLSKEEVVRIVLKVLKENSTVKYEFDDGSYMTQDDVVRLCKLLIQ